jgi:peptide deformylase
MRRSWRPGPGGRADGVTARALLHELDHLAGRLYVDLVPAEEIVLVEGGGPSG